MALAPLALKSFERLGAQLLRNLENSAGEGAVSEHGGRGALGGNRNGDGFSGQAHA